jgi:hypothetical protein
MISPRPPRRALSSLGYLVPLLALLMAAVALTDGQRFPAFATAVLASAALERHRQARRPRPLTLAATPRAWKAAVETNIGAAEAAVVTLLVAAAAWLVLARPELGPQVARSPTLAGAGIHSAPKSRIPRVRVSRSQPGRWFTADSAKFRALANPREPWAAALVGRAGGRGLHWVAIEVDTKNLRRHHFDPNTLDYRLHDGAGNVYHPDLGGGTGPATLSSPGLLRPGLIAESRLGFRVPVSAERLMLVFEPALGASMQIHVPVTGRRTRLPTRAAGRIR